MFSNTVHRYSILPHKIINMGFCLVTHIQTFCGCVPTALWMKSVLFLTVFTASIPSSPMLCWLFGSVTQYLFVQNELIQSRTSLAYSIQAVQYITII